MPIRKIENKRGPERNIMKNRIRPEEEPEFQLPAATVRSIQERDATVAALEVFIKVTHTGLKLPGRNLHTDEELLDAAIRVLSRIS